MRILASCLLCAAVMAAGCSKKEDHKPAPVKEPVRKAGLWSIETVPIDAGVPGPPVGLQVCIDEKTDRLATLVGGRMGPTAACTQTARRVGEGWSVKRICRGDERAVTIEATVSGDLEAEYLVDTLTRTDPPEPGQPAERQATITGRWLSDCGADQKPGDVTLSSGVIYNIAKGGPPAPP